MKNITDLIEAIAGCLGAVAATIAAVHARKSNQKASVIKTTVNGNLARLVDILGQAAIQIPHDVAAKVVSAPPVEIPPDIPPEDRLTLEWMQRLGKGNGIGNG